MSVKKGGKKIGQVVKRFPDGSYLEYDQGSFDGWCVYLTKSNGDRRPPRDADYFDQLKQLAKKYGTGQVYGDYVRVYDMTGKEVEAPVLAKISQIAESYKDDILEVDIMFSILYMAMISEEKKKNTKLGKRIKRLGVHSLLNENQSVSSAANFMRNMKWKEIAALCEERGF